MFFEFVKWSSFIICILCLIGFCHFCYQFQRWIWQCPFCGFLRPHRDTGKYSQRGPYAIERMVTIERCDNSTKECVDNEMVLIDRKLLWFLSRPFAWIWTSLVMFGNKIVDLVKTFNK